MFKLLGDVSGMLGEHLAFFGQQSFLFAQLGCDGQAFVHSISHTTP
jgi:hypothetical protein